MTGHFEFHARLCRERPDAGGPAANPFAGDTSVGQIVSNGCHECACEEVFAEVMRRVLRVKNTCSDTVCSTENFDAFRRRNLAISADYADIYLQPLGEAKRLKFAGGAAFGSTHIGYAMDLAAETLESWGSTMERRSTDLLMPDGTAISEDWNGPTFDLQELVSDLVMTGVGYDETLTGLRRLVYGNLAIYMDLGAVLHFCQIHEQRFGFFKDGRVDEFMECFERFVDYVKENHAQDHDVYGPEGSFGSEDGGYLRLGLRGVASDNLEQSLSIIDHEQRNILQHFMYRLKPGAISRFTLSSLGEDDEFKAFMNALDKTKIGHPYGTSPLFNGIRAQFSAEPDTYRLIRVIYGPAGSASAPSSTQPFIYPFESDDYGDDFTNPDVRTPWFQEVVRHFVRAETNSFDWPTPRPREAIRFSAPNRTSYDLPDNTPDLQSLLYADLSVIRGRG